MAVLYPFSFKAKELLENPPAPGEGRHHWLFALGSALKQSDWKPKKIHEMLDRVCAARGWTDRGGKTITDIVTKLDEAFVPGPASERIPDWPEEVQEERRARWMTPAMFDPMRSTGMSAQDVLCDLFDKSALVCVGWSKFKFSTLPLADVLPAAHQAPFVVANPMVAESAENGSKRCKANATRPRDRRFMVVEFDKGDTRTQQASVLTSLHDAEHPLAMAVWSGNKSIHGWYNVSGLHPYKKLRFFRFAVSLGADASLWDMSKLVRMPGGDRGGIKQDILYFERDHL